MRTIHKMDEKTDISAPKRAASRLAHSGDTLSSKELGDLGELAFILAATAKGLPVAKPYGDCRRYDLIVDSGRRLLRIQVKSVYRLYIEEPYRVACSRRQGSTRISYTVDEIDFLAAYLASRDLWYIVPIEEILNKRMMRFFPDGHSEPFDRQRRRYNGRGICFSLWLKQFVNPAIHKFVTRTQALSISYLRAPLSFRP